MFLTKFFPLGKTNVLHGKISSFQQTGMESISEALERLQEYIFSLSSSWDGRMAHPPKLLQWAKTINALRVRGLRH
jgi:hypothetical protein